MFLFVPRLACCFSGSVILGCPAQYLVMRIQRYRLDPKLHGEGKRSSRSVDFELKNHTLLLGAYDLNLHCGSIVRRHLSDCAHYFAALLLPIQLKFRSASPLKPLFVEPTEVAAGTLFNRGPEFFERDVLKCVPARKFTQNSLKFLPANFE